MSPRPLAPQPLIPARLRPSHVPTPTRNAKASFACLACKQRKSKCDQGSPCRICQIHGSPCIYDETADQRRKVAKQRLLDDYQRQRILLVGIIATIRMQEPMGTQQLLDMIRSDGPLTQLSTYIENMLTASPKLNDLARQLSFGPNDIGSRSPALSVSDSATPSLLEPTRAAGLPMNAQIILDVPI